ncbi:MerR family transcriptional regulator [Bacillus horti]|uniref:DNA-binding transcriptional MerR regulator n=1 Tax=Caldalkalibacillus horti TaxID=77523 RepID=A0ABT9VYD1_9BACI|nr:MerR family transcriptional regulator [Bacillus horti]MDQ0165875.1 DNA-binding transcriptional MerR regulator [Bacillus horti]
MRISELSVKTGVSIRSLRYYEEKELIIPERLGNGYRKYDRSAIERVKTIQLFLDLGLNTDEIAKILVCTSSISTHDSIPTSAHPSCVPEAVALYEDKLSNTQKQITALKEAEIKLESLLSFWRKEEVNKKVYK